MNLPAQAALARYGAVKVTTASPGHLLVMLYDGLIRFLREAAAAMVAKDRSRACERISRSHGIISHLLSSLDPQPAPELAQHLQSVYMFCMARLLTANLNQDPAKVDEVLRVMLPLREAWAIAVAEVGSNK